MPDPTARELTDADLPNEVSELRTEVADLSAMLTEISPALTELANKTRAVEENQVSFTTHEESKRRTRVAIVSVLIASFAGLILATLFILGVAVPKCYQTGFGKRGPSACDLIPGYKGTEQKSVALSKTFTQAQAQLAGLAANAAKDAKDNQVRGAQNAPRLDALELEMARVWRVLGFGTPPQLPKPAPLPGQNPDPVIPGVPVNPATPVPSPTG